MSKFLSSFWKRVLPDIELSGDTAVFLFSSLNISFHCLLACNILLRNTDDVFEESLYWYMTVCFSLAAFKIPSLSWHSSLIISYLRVTLFWVPLLWGLLSFLLFVYPCISSNLGSFWPLFLQIHSCSSPPGTSPMYMLVHFIW